MRDRARAVVIGGGVGGCSILYWLARLGWDDVILVERAELTSGSTFHSAGLVGQLPQHALADEDDDGQRRPLPVARGRGLTRDGMARGRVASPRLLARADGGDLASGRLGEDVRASARADLARRGAGALPAHDDGWRVGRGVPADGRLHRPQSAHVRTGGGNSAPGSRDRDRNARDGRRGCAWASDGRRDRPRRHRDRDRRERRRHVRARDRRPGRRERADRADGARVSDRQADRPSARHADDARPVAARLLPTGVGRFDHGRLRAELRPVGARRDPGGLQLAAPRGGLAPLRGADGERGGTRPVARRDGGREAHQRPGGLHSRRRVHPRSIRRTRLLGRVGILRPWARRRRRDGEARRGVDRRGHAVARRLAHGLSPLRLRLSKPAVHGGAHEGDLRDVLRRQVSGSRALRRPPASRVAGLRAAARPRCGLRREVRLGARELVRAERSAWRRVVAAPWVGRKALVAGGRGRACRLPRDGRDLRRELVREDPRRR